MFNFTDENFNKEVLEAKKPVLVDFWMQGCAPCLLLSPILEELTKEFSEKIIFAKVNLDTAPSAIQKYGINVVPTVILFKEGKPLSGFIGLRPEKAIRTWLEESLQEEDEKNESIGEEDKSSSSPFAAARVYEEYAKKNGFSLNPNKKVVEAIIRGLLEREKKFGAKFCPCRKITGGQEEDKKIICPCAYHLEELERDGKCLCGLFVKKIIK